MFEAAIASLAGVVGIVFWWLKNRAKTRKERDDEEIAYHRRLRDSEVDSWIHRR
jgi:nitrogen fixation-related uncharacterized protein